MVLTFDIGDADRPKGHAIVYFQSPTTSEVLATYVLILPIPMDIGKYLPPLLAAQLGGMAGEAMGEGMGSFAAPPMPEAVESVGAGAALVMQAIAVGTGAAIALAFVPQIDSSVTLVAGLAVAAACVGALTAKPVVRLLSGIARVGRELDPLPVKAVLLGTGSALAAWVTYGWAFWLLAHGVIPQHVPTLGTAVGSFAAAYIVGLLAVFTPGGLVVREGVLVGLLAPAIGTGPALVLSVGSRLLLTVTEVVAALLGLTIRPKDGEAV